jgi:HEAT repeat protein
MKQILSISFVAGLAIAAPAGAQVTPDVPRMGPPAPLGPMSLGPGPIGLGPIGPGPIGPGPIGTGPIGPFRWSPEHEQDRERERLDRERDQKERELQRAQAERDRQAQLYEEGNNALYEGRWDRAVNYFTRLADMKGARADSALYWKSYAQNRLGQRADSLATIAELTRSYPSSRYIKPAKALEVEVQGSTGAVGAQAQADEDLKLIAINALAQSDPTQAIPLLEKLLAGTASPRLKSRALYVLAQINTPRAREVVTSIAKGSSIPELQSRAIQYLGAEGGRESRATLAEIYSSSTDVDVKRRILRSFAQAGEKDRVLAAAQTEQNPELRSEAVRQLGQMGANDELWQMYQKDTSGDVKRQILSAMQVSGNTTRMVEIARTEKDPDLRLRAVRNLGVMGGKAAGDTLLEIYANEKDAAIRRAVINALFTQGNATALVALARKEQDMAMKTEIVKRLSNMDNKEAQAYMIELLTK